MIGTMLSMLAFSHIKTIIERKAVAQDTLLISKALTSAQLRALTSHQEARVCGDPSCTLSWGHDLFIVQHGSTHHVSLSGKTSLIVRAFPAHIEHQFIFTPAGMTDFQNASIYVCSQTSLLATQLRINQAGRVSISEGNAFEHC